MYIHSACVFLVVFAVIFYASSRKFLKLLFFNTG